MNEGIGFSIDHLAPFDIPTDEEKDKFITGENSVHLTSFVNYSKDKEVNYTSREFGTYLTMIMERGAIREKDYIITANRNIDGWFVQIHTTSKFITKEDGDGMVYLN